MMASMWNMLGMQDPYGYDQMSPEQTREAYRTQGLLGAISGIGQGLLLQGAGDRQGLARGFGMATQSLDPSRMMQAEHQARLMGMKSQSLQMDAAKTAAELAEMQRKAGIDTEQYNARKGLMDYVAGGGDLNTPQGQSMLFAGGFGEPALKLQSSMMDKGLRVGPGGSVQPVPGFGASQGANEAAKTAATMPLDVQKAGAVAAAQANAAYPTQLALAQNKPFELSPGTVVLPGGVGGGGSPITSPYPAPGTPESEISKGLAGLKVGTVKDLQAQAGKAAEQLSSLSKMKAAINRGLETGATAPITGMVGNWLSSLGLGDDIFKATDKAQFQKAAREMLLKGIGSLGAQVSNSDREFYEDMLPRLSDPYQATLSIMDYLEKRGQGQIDLADKAYQAALNGGDPMKVQQEYWRSLGGTVSQPQLSQTPRAANGSKIGKYTVGQVIDTPRGKVRIIGGDPNNPDIEIVR